MGPHKLADTLSISLQEAEELFILYAKNFPNLNKWLDSQADFAVKNGYSLTFSPCKRRRYYPELESIKHLLDNKRLTTEEWKLKNKIEGQVRRNGTNMPIQGSGADICKEALIEIRELIKNYNSKYNEPVAYLICTVHDAIDVEVREDLANQFALEMADIMKSVGNKYVTQVKMEVDTTITKMWMK